MYRMRSYNYSIVLALFFDLPIKFESLQELLSVGKGSSKANVVSNDKYIMKINK